MLTTRTQRWRDRRCRWIPNASEIDPARLSVDVIDTRLHAAPFVKAHHYAASMPVARLSIGLFANGKGGRSELVGVCVFSHPVNNASVPKTAGLSNPRTACDLGRLVIDQSQGGKAESFLVSRAFRILRREKPEILSVIADSNDRDQPFQHDGDQHSTMIAISGDHRVVVEMGVIGRGGGQAWRVGLARRMLSPSSSIRWALWTRRSRMASA
jgi:hypothetical protein